MDKTAILFFALSPQQEALKKRFFKNNFVAKKTALLLWEYHHHLIVQSGKPFFWYNENNQQGHSFGERIYNALREVFDKGFTKIMVLPADIPAINKQKLSWYLQKLEKTDAVFAPDYRGGLAFFGISGAVFENTDLRKLPWRTKGLCLAFIGLLKTHSFRFFAYSKLHDINNGKDLIRLTVARLLPRLIIIYIESFILRWIPFSKIFSGIRYILQYLKHRAPPNTALT